VTIYPVPGADPRLIGLAQCDGEPIAVLDLLHLVEGADEIGSGPPVVVVVRAGAEEALETLGLAVDEALEVATIPERLLTTDGAGGLVRGTASFGDGTVRVLDLSALGETG
jgi:chemotaxis signal transduction protein